MWWHVHEHLVMRHVLRHLEPQCDVCTRMKVSRNNLVWNVSIHTPVGYSGSLSTVHKTNCNKKTSKKNVSSLPTPFGCVPPRRTWRWQPIFPSFMLVNSSAGQIIFGENFLSLLCSSLLTWMDGLFNLVLLIRGVSDFSPWQRLRNQI